MGIGDWGLGIGEEEIFKSQILLDSFGSMCIEPIINLTKTILIPTLIRFAAEEGFRFVLNDLMSSFRNAFNAKGIQA